MGSSYEQTHKDILNSAKQNFLKNGYERSNLREICKGAKVTTGAFYRHFKDKEAVFNELVNDVIKQVYHMYLDVEKHCYERLDNNEYGEIWNTADYFIVPFIEFIYKNYDVFKLLLMYSDGTAYGNFLDDIVVLEVKKMLKYIRNVRKRGIRVAEVDNKELHMLIHAYFSSFFEIVMHDYSKEDAIKYSKTLIRFFNPGWKAIFEI